MSTRAVLQPLQYTMWRCTVFVQSVCPTTRISSETFLVYKPILGKRHFGIGLFNQSLSILRKIIGDIGTTRRSPHENLVIFLLNCEKHQLMIGVRNIKGTDIFHTLKIFNGLTSTNIDKTYWVLWMAVFAPALRMSKIILTFVGLLGVNGITIYSICSVLANSQILHVNVIPWSE
jgi:hypothetical protein